MAKTHVNITDHILDMKNKINDISDDIGDISLISTSGQDSDVVQAINSLDSDIGGIANLSTIDKSSIKSAINELDAEIGAATLTTSASTVKGAINEHEIQINQIDSDVGNRTSLTTTADQNLVVAINEVDGIATAAQSASTSNTNKLGTITSGAMGTTASTVGAAIAELHSEIDSAETVSGSLSNLITTSKVNLVSAINEVRLLGVDSDGIIDIFSAANTGTGFGTLSFDGAGVYSFAKVTNANIRSAISAGEGIDITSGSISGEDATATNKGIAKFNTGNFSVASGDVTIKTGGVAATQLASNAVTSIKINGSAVTTAKINNSAVTTDKINNTAVTTAKVADDAITYAKLQNLVTANRVLGSTSTGLIGEVLVASAMIAGDAIDGSKIADDAINSEHYVDGSIDPAHLASNAVTEVKIASNAVTSDKIASNAVTSAKIASNAVTQAKMADDAVGSAELKSVVSLVIYNSAGTAVKTLYGAGS